MVIARALSAPISTFKHSTRRALRCAPGSSSETVATALPSFNSARETGHRHTLPISRQVTRFGIIRLQGPASLSELPPGTSLPNSPIREPSRRLPLRSLLHRLVRVLRDRPNTNLKTKSPALLQGKHPHTNFNIIFHNKIYSVYFFKK